MSQVGKLVDDKVVQHLDGDRYCLPVEVQGSLFGAGAPPVSEFQHPDVPGMQGHGGSVLLHNLWKPRLPFGSIEVLEQSLCVRPVRNTKDEDVASSLNAPSRVLLKVQAMRLS